jgi:hypothetical protein
MTSVPDITRLLARIHEWQEGHGKPGGRADAVHRLDEANKLLEEIANMLTEMRREMLGPATRDARPGVIDGATAALVPGRDAGLSDPGALHRQDSWTSSDARRDRYDGEADRRSRRARGLRPGVR